MGYAPNRLHTVKVGNGSERVLQLVWDTPGPSAQEKYMAIRQHIETGDVVFYGEETTVFTKCSDDYQKLVKDAGGVFLDDDGA